ncbi:phosphoribosyltransferase domain-containing protein [Deinococcus cellulosilyticus]|uniref:Phosphoribosyltransferase n=1 Tax=Deinococcus cellulosilyticus (strain DSM 18568 / NBRC 106333 / KACC 11606 / 5516J-15) TaxID=1223518 RepID=A0A511MUX8_DEIC1|nr:phosphoribosyltransferase domain-containing protein [Deinococcus cellulosilyticus]GEM44399.1 hypothetical protein DC3_00340 [Deinococcus cellulosilyticus NBRC 106333 = KACC 11606]
MNPGTLTASRTVVLPSGTLKIQLTTEHVPLDSITEYAVRQNPRRGFLFVSKILGKHLPVKPSEALRHHRWLASSLPSDAEGPVLFIGMAETATGLATSVFEEYCKSSGREDALYLPSTRYRLGERPTLLFQETHSHATDHLIYPPAAGHKQQLWEKARTLVLIDDEITTGKTLKALSRTLKEALPGLKEVHLVCFTSWMQVHEGLEEEFGLPVHLHALVYGEMQFEANPEFSPPELPKVVGNGADKTSIICKEYSRLGRLPSEHSLPEEMQALIDALPAQEKPILVLGTGEFAYEPLRFAAALEEKGHEVVFHTTTRSPILIGEVIHKRIEFPDNYGDDIPNYLYNLDPEQYSRIFLCFETLPTEADQALAARIQAQTVYF